MKPKTRTTLVTGSLHRYKNIAFTSILSAVAILAMLSSTVIVAAEQPTDLAGDLETSEINLSLNKNQGIIRWFNGRPVRPARTITMTVTAYSPDAQSCGEFADGITASGYSVKTNGMKLVAADTTLIPFGTKLSIPDYDDSNIVPVLDRGGAIKGNHLDALFSTHEEALQWGVRELDVTIWEYADGQADDFHSIY